MIPNSRETLINYCLRNLGYPVIQINVDKIVDFETDATVQFFKSISSLDKVTAFVNTVGFTNIVDSVGSPGTAFRNNSNFFDVSPPTGKTMANFVAFIPRISFIAFNGNVNRDDTMRCQWSTTVAPERIRVWVQNTEQRARPRGNYLAVWS